LPQGLRITAPLLRQFEQQRTTPWIISLFSRTHTLFRVAII